jgi:hypothetical protein
MARSALARRATVSLSRRIDSQPIDLANRWNTPRKSCLPKTRPVRYQKAGRIRASGAWRRMPVSPRFATANGPLELLDTLVQLGHEGLRHIVRDTLRLLASASRAKARPAVSSD